MKRRTLLTGSIWSGFLAMTALVRAALAPSPKPQQSEITPYEAIQLVYDEFESVDSVSEIEFNVMEHADKPADSKDYVRCKLVAKTSPYSKYENTWLVFYESIHVFPEHGFVKKSRELKVLNVISEEVHQATSSEEYDEKKFINTFWSSGGSLVALVGEHHHPDHVGYRMETGNFFSAEKSNQKNPRIVALSRFLGLLTR